MAEGFTLILWELLEECTKASLLVDAIYKGWKQGPGKVLSNKEVEVSGLTS